MKKILIVDDSPTMLMSIESVLKKAGYEISAASSGEKAFELLQGGLKIDLMITDYHMGAMDGIALIRSSRKLPHVRFTPILMVTTESQQEKRHEAKAAGATGWLVKPVEGEALIKVVRQVIPGT
jgi:two-component system chemotaxis response regulator CheY